MAESGRSFTPVSEIISIGIKIYGWEVDDLNGLVERSARQLASCSVDTLVESKNKDAYLLLVMFARGATESQVSAFLADSSVQGRDDLLLEYADGYQSCFREVAAENALTND